MKLFISLMVLLFGLSVHLPAGGGASKQSVPSNEESSFCISIKPSTIRYKDGELLEISTTDQLDAVQGVPEQSSHKVKRLNLSRDLFGQFDPLSWPALEVLELLTGEQELAEDWGNKNLAACKKLRFLVLRVNDFVKLQWLFVAENSKILLPASLLMVTTWGNAIECNYAFAPDRDEHKLNHYSNYSREKLKGMGFKFATE